MFHSYRQFALNQDLRGYQSLIRLNSIHFMTCFMCGATPEVTNLYFIIMQTVPTKLYQFSKSGLNSALTITTLIGKPLDENRIFSKVSSNRNFKLHPRKCFFVSSTLIGGDCKFLGNGNNSISVGWMNV